MSYEKRTNKPISFNPLDSKFLGGDQDFIGWSELLDKAKHHFLGEDEVELTEKEKEFVEQNARLGIENPPEIQRKLDVIEAREARESEDDIDSTYTSLLGEESESGDNGNIAEELSYSLEPEDQWVQRHVDAENKGKDLAREDYLLRRGGERTSGGMTNNAFASESPASKMSPAGKQAMVGLLKDFLTPAPDDPPPQVRSAGITRGSTPFPSLLQNRPERKYYENKGLV